MTATLEKPPEESTPSPNGSGGASVPPAPKKVRVKGGPGEGRTGWLMLLPAILLLSLFLGLPFFASFYFSVTDQRLASPNPTEYVGAEQFDRLLSFEWVTLSPSIDEDTGEFELDRDGNVEYPLRDTIRNNPDNPQFDGLQEFWSIPRSDDQRTFFLVGDRLFVRSLLNTIFFALVIVPLQAGFGLFLAVLVNQRMRGINIFRAIYFMPVVTSMVVISILWQFIYAKEGLLNSLISKLTFGAFGGQDWLGETSTAMPAMMGMSIWQAVGLHMVVWLAGLQTIPGVLYEAAAIDGASPWQKFKHVTWPGLRSTRVFILITITIAAFGLFVQVDVMTNGGPLDSTSSIIFYAVRQGWKQQNIAYGSAISLIFFVMVLVVALIQRRLTRAGDVA